MLFISGIKLCRLSISPSVCRCQSQGGLWARRRCCRSAGRPRRPGGDCTVSSSLGPHSRALCSLRHDPSGLPPVSTVVLLSPRTRLVWWWPAEPLFTVSSIPCAGGHGDSFQGWEGAGITALPWWQPEAISAIPHPSPQLASPRQRRAAEIEYSDPPTCLRPALPLFSFPRIQRVYWAWVATNLRVHCPSLRCCPTPRPGLSPV